MQDGMDYMRIVGAFAFFQALSLTLSASLRSANKAIYPMMVTVVVNILNIIGNYSLIFGRFGFPELGVEGAAISTASAGCLHDYTVRHTVPQAHPPFPTGILPPFSMDRTKEPDEGRPALRRRTIVVQLVAGRHHLLHQHVGSGSARHPYLLCQHHHVRLSVQHLHGTRRSHLYRASDRREETSRSLPYGKIRHEEIRHDYRHAVLHPRSFGACHLWLAHVQPRHHTYGCHHPYHRCTPRNRPPHQHLRHQRPSCGRRCQLPLPT